MQPMPITPEEQRFLLYFLSEFREQMDKPEQEEADSLVDRIQKHRKGVEMTNQNTPGLDAEREAFLAWDKEIYALPEHCYHEYKGGFGNLAVEGRWKAWQARSQLATTAQAEPVTIAQYSRCTNTLRTLGRPYPRTCQECGLGPCKTKAVGPQPASAPVVGGDDWLKAARKVLDEFGTSSEGTQELYQLLAASKAKPADVAGYVENEGQAFYNPGWGKRLSEIEGEWKKKYAALQCDYEKYQGNAETAIKRALRQSSDAHVSIGEHGEVMRHGGRTEQIQ